jgi:nicotinate-nucleotide pyrophosphorylase (carboxylating)
LAGIPFFNRIFETLGCTIRWYFQEGQWLSLEEASSNRLVVATVEGPARQLLLGERPALNMLARACGIATRARQLQKLRLQHGWQGVIAGTRKTTPGFRIVEKYAMVVGGCDSHRYRIHTSLFRYDLSSMVMLKDNHVNAAGSIASAISKAKSVAGFSVKIEVECQNEREAEEAIIAGADIVMLDNFKPDQLAISSASLKSKFPNNAFLIEGSGGLTLENITGYFAPSVDILSFGSLSQSVPHIDFSLKIPKNAHEYRAR